jgi:N6-L-threonylcarbamoyladenine synthase
VLAQRIASQDDAHRPMAASSRKSPPAPMPSGSPADRRGAGDAGMGAGDVDAIAATAGPGLIGGVMVGLVTAKALAMAERQAADRGQSPGRPCALAAAGRCRAAFPYLLLLVSGGHCQLLMVEGVGRYRRLATTIDDALGEAFDKTAKILGLGFPGGPAVERLAREGDPQACRCRARCWAAPSRISPSPASRARCCGRKEAGIYGTADIAASFQQACDRLRHRPHPPRAGRSGPVNRAGRGGGVAANHAAIRAALTGWPKQHGLPFVAPPLALCTDNAAMIAWAGIERLADPAFADDPLDFAARPRWPLDPDAAPVRGAGVKA